MNKYSAYETVIGLEVHAQLLTNSKLFCGDSIQFGGEPNSQVSPITLAHPGTLPRLNKKAVEFAIKMGIACNCEIEKNNYFARKNYFYPDLPKGYQISQHTTPVCKNGFISIEVNGEKRNIRLNRIHLEEDAGKSLHDIYPDHTCIDYNRAGTPLIEIVTEPDLRSADEAYAYLTELRKMVRYLDICDGNMEEGSLRCDANISVRKKNDPRLGTRVEVKNLNSIRNVKKAIEVEAERLCEILEQGGTIIQQTLSFDADKGRSFPIRDKEDAEDYRYFPDPDLTPFQLNEAFIKKIKAGMPLMQSERKQKYISELKLSEYDAQVLTEDRAFADYFENITHYLEGKSAVKAAANWMLGPVRSWLNEHNEDIFAFPLKPEKVGILIELVEEGKLSFSTASGKLFDLLIHSPDADPETLAIGQNLLQESDVSSLEPIVNEVLRQFADKVMEYKKGKKGVLGLFVGEVMKRSGGKADPKITNELLLQKLKSS
jgi:aspartyl-tRNA(Asn)/glutamyl-tRNA(Gln) amidotransferase subunit B